MCEISLRLRDRRFQRGRKRDPVEIIHQRKKAVIRLTKDSKQIELI